MTRRILITPEGDAFLDGDLHDAGGITLEADMGPSDTLPAHVIPCPERRFQLEHSEWLETREWEISVGCPLGLFSGPEPVLA